MHFFQSSFTLNFKLFCGIIVKVVNNVMTFWIILGSILGLAALAALIIAGIRFYTNFKRSRNMVFLKMMVPRKESKEELEREREQFSSQKDFKEITGVMTHLFDALHSMYNEEISGVFLGQNFFSLEYAVIGGQIYLNMVVPRDLESLVEKQVTSFYPDCYIEKVQDYNIFKEGNYAVGKYMFLKKHFLYPIRTYARLNSDPINTLTNALSKLRPDEGAAIQIMIRPAKDGWQKKGRKVAKGIFMEKKKTHLQWWNPLTWFVSIFEMLVHGEKKTGEQPSAMMRVTPLTEDEVKAMEEKNNRVGYETIIRLVASSPSHKEAETHLQNIKSAFAQYTFPNGNSFHYTKYHSNASLIYNFIFRRFRRNMRQWLLSGRRMIMSSEELASLFHLPNIRYNQTPQIAWQNFRIAPAPANLPLEGLLLGYNTYRGITKEIRLKREDRFRHFYIIGQTGTGKSSIMQVMIRQDFLKGDGCAVIDPHGSLIEDVIPFIPRERADDVIYFNPADMERPMGMNLLEGDTWEEKELIALDAMNIMIKLFGEEVFGPRIQDYFRNGCLTLMSDPEGGALTDIVRLFTDDDFQRYKVEKVTNPIVKSFWEHQMAKTGAREKQEMIPYFAAKFGQFVTNTLMRNIIGQTKSAFDFGKVMQEGKILLVNLSKGDLGEINSKLLGLILVSKIQMASLRRQRVAKNERRDFFLYIDEFQNYVTDSIEVILSEARKYRLGLIMAHQYLAQLDERGGGLQGKAQSRVRDAVFGNVGSIMCYKIGAQDTEYLVKEFSPTFSEHDLINLDKFKGVMKISVDTQPSRPFSITPVNPYIEKGDFEAAEAFKQLSRLKFGRDREFVEREIIRRIGATV